MGTTSHALMSFEEFEQLDDTAEELELLEGELIRMPPPSRNHMEIVERLFVLLKAQIDALRQSQVNAPWGNVHVEMGFLVGSSPRSWVRPDVSLTYPAQPGDKYYEGAPLIAFEVVSEEDRATRLRRKVKIALEGGAAEVWLIYPETRDAFVYKAGHEVPMRETAFIQSELLPGVEISFDRFL